jgi:hypothetical protein
VADEYAARIEQDLGVQVKVHDLWGGNLPVSTILDALRGKPHTWISALSEEHIDPIPYIEMAEVIVVYGNEWGSQTAEHPWVWSCYEEEPYPVCRETTSCGPETFAQYEANLAAIFEEIFAIRGGEPVILRTVDLYLPWGPLEAWRACNEEEICKQCHLNWSDAIHRVADKYGVPVAGLLKAFSGPDLSLDMPREFIMDDRHPSAKGAAAIADVLADLGYEPVAPIKMAAPFAGVQGIKTSGDSLWAWTDREIWRYKEGEWSYYTTAIDNLNDVAYISDTLWAMDNSRLQYFDGNEWQEPQGIYADEIEADDEFGILWILTGIKLYRWDVEEMSYIERRSVPDHNFYPHNLAVTGDGSVWAGGIYGYVPTLGGLARYDDTTGSWEKVRPWHDGEDVPAQVMAATPDGDLWVMLVDWSGDWEALQEAGEPFVEWALAYWDSASEQWTVFEQDLPEGYPMVMAADDGGVWLAQGGGLIEQMLEFDGLVHFDGENWSHYLPGTDVDDVAVAPDGTIWYMTWDDDVLRKLQ